MSSLDSIRPQERSADGRIVERATRLTIEARRRIVRRLLARASVAIGAGLLASASAARGDVFRVGVGSGCTHATLEEALAASAANGPGLDEIRLHATPDPVAPIEIADQSVSIQGANGNLPGCHPSESLPWQIVFRESDGFRVSGGATQNRTVEFANIRVLMGTFEVPGGQTLRVEGRVHVILSGMFLSGGEAVDGGNVQMSGPHAVLTVGPGTLVYQGHATRNGGGIHCSGGGTIGIQGEAYRNQADQQGGGIYLNGCTLNMIGGSILSNRAETAGGGIYATGGSAVHILSTETDQAVVRDNYAEEGGGLALVGSGTTLEAIDTEIRYNRSSSYGAGVLLRSGASFTMERQLDECTSSPGRLACSELTNNRIFPTTNRHDKGGAIAVLSGGTATIRQTLMRGNSGPDGGAVAYVAAPGSVLVLEGDVLQANDTVAGGELIAVDDSATARLAFVTVAGNASGRSIVRIGTDAHAELFSSILASPPLDPVGLLGEGASVFTDCLIVPASEPAIPGAETVSTVAEPSALFVDLEGGDLHLRPGSPAIDFCDGFFYTPTDDDIDGEPRGFDEPSRPDHIGWYDLGADESYAPEPRDVAAAALAALAMLRAVRRARA